MDAQADRPRMFVVSYSGLTDLRVGSGQRTRTFFDAARRLGPVEIVSFGFLNPEHAAASYPEAQGAHGVDVELLATGGRLSRALSMLAPLFWPARHFAPKRDAEEALDRIIGARADAIVLFRYLPTFCASGLRSDPERRFFVCVDVDDLPEQKYRSYFVRLMGGRITDVLAVPLLLRPLTRYFERRLEAASLAFYVTREDVSEIPGVVSEIAPNAAFVAPGAGDMPPASAARDLLFVGAWNHRPNRSGVLWFLKHVWPEIHAHHPEAQFRIVGRGPWHRLASLIALPPGVEIVGEVSDLGAEYARARAAVCPMSEGGGSKIKLIEACRYGRPVVTTTLSTRGFGDGLARIAAVADTPQAFAAACCRLLSDPAEADASGAALQAYERAHFSRETVTRKIADVLSRLWVSQAEGATPAGHMVGAGQ